MTAATNQRWYSANGTLLFANTGSGEVRITLFEKADGRAYIMATGHANGDQGQFIANQLNGAVINERYTEDFSWVQETLDELLVSDDRCKIAWGACRGTMKDTEREDLADVIALIIAADLYPNPHDAEEHLRIATFPIGQWENRREAVEQAWVTSSSPTIVPALGGAPTCDT
jgi:hypothetical protein